MPEPAPRVYRQLPEDLPALPDGGETEPAIAGPPVGYVVGILRPDQNVGR